MTSKICHRVATYLAHHRTSVVKFKKRKILISANSDVVRQSFRFENFQRRRKLLEVMADPTKIKGNSENGSRKSLWCY